VTFYWIALITHSIETLGKLFVVLIDIAYISAPVIERPLSLKDSVSGYAIILATFRLAFHTKLFLFFWNKIFHGDRDLFSEPCTKLDGSRSCTQDLRDGDPPEGKSQGGNLTTGYGTFNSRDEKIV
jgi:hypothetical protein